MNWEENLRKNQREQVLRAASVTGQDTLIRKAMDVFEKGGEGSRGGKVIGHTKSGKPIYAETNAKHESTYNSQDHKDAAYAHLDTKTERGSSEFDRHMGTSQHKKKNEELDEEDKKVKKVLPEKGTPNWHKLQIAKDTVKNPAKAFLGGQTLEEAKGILKEYGLK